MPDSSPYSPALPPTLQRLSPHQARFCLTAARFMEKELALSLAGQRILVAYSGGADSTALLLALHYLAPGKDFSLCAAHLDHSLRPASAREADECRRLCLRLNIPFFTRRLDIAAISRKNGTGLEECARRERYAFLSSVALQENCDWIAAAHNQNDLAEDILMRLIRGAGWPGLGGMPALDWKRHLVRPLLLHPREAIEDFLVGLGVNWATDESNTDPAYLRNRVRSSLLPLILQENPSFLDSAAGLWRLARIDEAWFAGLLPPVTAPSGQENTGPDDGSPDVFTDMDDLRGLPKALRLRLYKNILQKLGGGQALLDNLLRLDAGVEEAVRGKGPGRAHQFPGGKRAVVNARGITWSQPRTKKRRGS